MDNKNELQLMLNSLAIDENDPTIIKGTFAILDDKISKNNVIVTDEGLTSLANTIKHKPIKTKYSPTSDTLSKDDNFGDHEVVKISNRDGKDYLFRETVAIGVFTSEGYFGEVEVDGEKRKVLLAEANLWRSLYPDAISLLIELFNKGVKINMSCEYTYPKGSAYFNEDGVELHTAPLYFEGHALLKSSDGDNRIDEVIPAYDSATLLNYEQLEEFNVLVAQALNQEKEEDNLEENVQVNEEVETEIVDEEVAEELETELNADEETELETQLNEVSLEEIRTQIREQVRESLDGNSYAWVSDVYQTYAIVNVETETSNEYDYGYYKYEFTLADGVASVNLESKVEVREKREWVTVTNELSTQVETLTSEKVSLESQLNELTTSKEDLIKQFNTATETITTLNAQIEELKPLQEQIFNAQREEKLATIKDKFEKAFNNVGAKDKYESEEVQTLLNQAIDDTNAELQLNSMIVNFVAEKQVVSNDNIMFNSLQNYRKDLVPTKNDILSDYRL